MLSPEPAFLHVMLIFLLIVITLAFLVTPDARPAERCMGGEWPVQATTCSVTK